MRPALLVIDLQRWFFKPPARQAALRTLVARVNELIDVFHQADLPVVHVLTVHQADGSTGDLWMKRNGSVSLVEGTPDAELCTGVRRFNSDLVVTKTRHSAFIRTTLEEVLGQIGADAVVLAGFSINACVGLTAIDAYERDFDVMIARDAILGCDHDRAAVMLKMLRNEFSFEPIATSVIQERLSNRVTHQPPAEVAQP